MAEHKERYTFFWKSHSPFSQWHPSVFTVDGVEFNCAEQFMMYQKAMLFEDPNTAQRILDTPDPRRQKSLGREVQNFNDDAWQQNCRDIVKRGNLAKFSQNKDLLSALLATEGTVLVEASPQDRIWGIGLTADNPRAHNKNTWRGSNWLGYALTDARNELVKQQAR